MENINLITAEELIELGYDPNEKQEEEKKKKSEEEYDPTYDLKPSPESIACFKRPVYYSTGAFNKPFKKPVLRM